MVDDGAHHLSFEQHRPIPRRNRGLRMTAAAVTSCGHNVGSNWKPQLPLPMLHLRCAAAHCQAATKRWVLAMNIIYHLSTTRLSLLHSNPQWTPTCCPLMLSEAKRYTSRGWSASTSGDLYVSSTVESGWNSSTCSEGVCFLVSKSCCGAAAAASCSGRVAVGRKSGPPANKKENPVPRPPAPPHLP